MVKEAHHSEVNGRLGWEGQAPPPPVIRLETAHATAKRTPQYHLCHITWPQESAPRLFEVLVLGSAAFLTAPSACVRVLPVGSAGVTGVDGADTGVFMPEVVEDESEDEVDLAPDPSSFCAMLGTSRATGPQY